MKRRNSALFCSACNAALPETLRVCDAAAVALRAGKRPTQNAKSLSPSLGYEVLEPPALFKAASRLDFARSAFGVRCVLASLSVFRRRHRELLLGAQRQWRAELQRRKTEGLAELALSF
jgi:hypothetical protein